MDHWLDFHKSWLTIVEGQCDLIIVTHHDLVTDLPGQLIRLAKFLHIQAFTADHLQCVINNQKGHFKRTKKEDQKKAQEHVYSKEQLARIYKNVQALHDYIWTNFHQNITI